MHQPLLYETHSHTPLCRHAFGEPEEYAAAAHTEGLRGLIVTCHNPMPNGFSAHVRMRPDEFFEYIDMVERARETWDDRVDVRLGLEADYFQGYEEWLESQLNSADFHYVLGSVHPQIEEFRARFWSDGDPLSFQQTYFDMLARAAETRLFDCLAHPDLVKNETPRNWDPAQILDVIRRALDRIAATGIAMELNTSGANKVIREMNPFPQMLREMNAREIPVVIGADAHVPERVGDRFIEALQLLKETGYESVSYFLERQRREVAIDDALESLLVGNAP